MIVVVALTCFNLLVAVLFVILANKLDIMGLGWVG